jgi:hypothetical protein
MALNPEDPIPTGISAADSYSRIRDWYQANVERIQSRDGDYAKKSVAYIRAMSVSPTSEQMQDTFKQVLTGLLEWAYHESDGKYKMAAYARAGQQ